MSKQINFIYTDEPSYSRVLDCFIDPIIKYIPDAKKSPCYLDDCINISFFVEDYPHKGILMSHGIADKKWRDGSLVADYDYIFVSGPLWKYKMLSESVPENKVLINGYTKMDPIFQNKKLKIRNTSKINVLYAPTHNVQMLDNSVSSYPRLLQYLDNVPEDIEFIVSPHPANNDKKITLESLLSADVVISDCSSMLYEAWALDAPVVFPDWLVKEPIMNYLKLSFEEKIYSQKIGYHAENINDMWHMVRKAKRRGIDKITRNFINQIFPPYLRGNSGKVTSKLLLKIASE
jgi:hypothetical protein